MLDGTLKINQTLTAPTGAIGEAKLYFPAMSNGVVPFVKEDNNEASGRIINRSYDAQPL